MIPAGATRPGTAPRTSALEYAAQQDALSQAGGTGVERPGDNRRQRLQLLLAAESAGAMIAAEMQHTGVPWREELHEQILADYLGPRPPQGHRPAKLEALTAELRQLLNSPALNPDSPQELMRALHRNGIEVKTTRQWELKESSHPAIEPLLAFKKLSRLHAANGWAWLDAWVKNGRFQPEYVVGGVVSGRWASRGGGALQIPRQIRGAVHADPGHKLIVADASQLEPRVLVALAQDSKMAEAARDKDLYAGIAAQGFGGDRAKAKVALLGAIYGATTGESGRLMPQLTRTYPRAVGFVEQAAREGEAGQDGHLTAGPQQPAAVRALAAKPAVDQRRGTAQGRFDRPLARPVHPQLRRPGFRGGLGGLLAGRTTTAAPRHACGRRPRRGTGLLPARRSHGPLPRSRGGRLHPGHRGGRDRRQGTAVRQDSGGIPGQRGGRGLVRQRQIGPGVARRNVPVGSVVPACDGGYARKGRWLIR